MNQTVMLALTAASIFLSSSAVMAVPVSADYKFSGIATSVDTPISSRFHAGEIVSGRMTLTLAVSESQLAYYAISNFSANIGGHYPITQSKGSLAILNDFGGSIDQVKLDITRQVGGLSAATVAGHVPDYFSFNLLYEVSDLTSTGLLPQFIFNSPYDRSNLRFDVNDSIEVKFQLTDFSLVPEPGTLWLSFVGAALTLLHVPKWHARRSNGIWREKPSPGRTWKRLPA